MIHQGEHLISNICFIMKNINKRYDDTNDTIRYKRNNNLKH